MLEVDRLRAQLAEAEETLRAIRNGEVDAFVLPGGKGEQVFTLKGAEQPYRILIEEMEEGAVMLDNDNSILYCNSGFARMLKMPLEKLIGTGIAHYIWPADHAAFEGLLHLEKKEGSNGEISFIAGDGMLVMMHLSLKSLQLDRMAVISLVAMDITRHKRAEEELRKARDGLEKRVDERTAELMIANIELNAEIMQRRRAEEALRESEQCWATTLASIGDAVVSTDVEGQVTFMNTVAEALTGWTFAEALEKPVTEVFNTIDEHTPRKADEPVTRVLKEGMIIGLANHTILTRKDGTAISIDNSCAPIRDGEGKITGIVLVFRDITERKQAEESLRKAHDELEIRVQERTAEVNETLKEKEMLLREIHHRVKNNMQVISGLLMLQEELSNDERVIGMIKDSQNRIASMALIHEKLYRSENLSKIDFKEYVDDLVRSLFSSYGLGENKVALNINIENISLGVDFAIPCGLIINELVSNSLKHAFPDGKYGEIKIYLHSTGSGMIELLAGDNGAGIPEDLDFRKTESLGLHIVNILVENQLHGEITLNKDKGTEFLIKFRGMK